MHDLCAVQLNSESHAGDSEEEYKEGVGLVAMGMDQGGKFALMAYLVE